MSQSITKFGTGRNHLTFVGENEEYIYIYIYIYIYLASSRNTHHRKKYNETYIITQYTYITRPKVNR